MAYRRLRARLWLEHYGLFPRGKLAFFTLYVLGLDLLLLVIQQSAGAARGSFANSLSGWTIFLTLFAFVLATVLGVRPPTSARDGTGPRCQHRGTGAGGHPPERS